MTYTAQDQRHVSLCHLIEEKIRQTPDVVAVIFKEESFTYKELGQRANQIAARLRSSGVKRNSLVGLHLERSALMVAAILGIHRAGGAYVPLDTSYPADRLDYIVQDSGLAHLLHDGDLKITTPVKYSTNLNEQLPLQADSYEEFSSEYYDLAYVIYTSGSTGKPKGVKVHHGALINFLKSMKKRPGLNSQDILLAVTTPSFDISALELFLPLMVGAKIILASKDEVIDGNKLAALLSDHAVTVMQATPATWRMLFAAGWSGSPKLKALCGGEKLDKNLAAKLYTAVGSLWNMYGPTETTVWSACGQITDPTAPISVGLPISRTALYILDDKLQPVPNGETGELYIGGAGVALGYTDEQQTKSRFIKNPFSNEPEDRLYKTGDLASFLPDSTLDIKGRVDFQVKVKGHRVELGEIEEMISQFGGIDQAVVITHENKQGDNELVTFFINDEAHAINANKLKSLLADRLPPYMVPLSYIKVSQFPLTANGKVDRISLAALYAKDSNLASAVTETFVYSNHKDLLTQIVCRISGAANLGADTNFFDAGLDSLGANQAAALFMAHASVKISVAMFFEYPTVNKLIGHLEDNRFIESVQKKMHARSNYRHSTTEPENELEGKVAIIGMAGRFPGADTLEQLWEILADGSDAITHFSKGQDDPLIDEETRNNPHYIRARGMIKNPELFDASFFGIRPNDAVVMDPQQRVFLETAWEALENAGYDANRFDGLIGVYAGMGNNFYYHYNVSTHPELIKMVGEVQAEIGREKDHIATLISHRLNLTGPSLSIHTACSTALVSIDSAYHSLLSHQCDMALAGGIEIRTPQMSGQVHEPDGIFTSDGRCSPFSDDASGTMFSDGAGVVVLKRLKDALKDGDTIHAVLIGSAVNHDGLNKKSYLAPSVKGQMEVIAMAHARAQISPETITYVEAHGTGTPVGDPIEFEAIKNVFEFSTDKKNFCAIGSIKANLGHPTTAAGVAGVIKTALSLKHKKIPPLIHFSKINPNIDIDNSPFFINTKLIDWCENRFPRRGSVSSFGFCGTNAHVVLEEAPVETARSDQSGRSWQILRLSAATETALEKAANNMACYLQQDSAADIRDVAYTLDVGRKRLRYRRFIVCQDRQEAVEKLQALVAPGTSKKTGRDKPKLCFIFPGQGSQYVNMGQGLYKTEPVFQKAIDRCAEILLPYIGEDIRGVMMGALPEDFKEREKKLNDTYYTQLSLFCLEYSLAQLWMSWGVQPEAMAGHSIGEFVCATIAGVFSLEDALKIVSARCKLMRDLPQGGMLSVKMPYDALLAELNPELSVAAVNSPNLCVVSGKKNDIELLKNKLEQKKILCRHLHTSHAFHSWMMEPAVQPFLETIRSIRFHAPAIPIISTVTGQKMRVEDATNPEYWARHLRVTVQFSEAISRLWENDDCMLLEIGPRGTMSSLALSQVRLTGRQIAIPSLSDTAEDDAEYASIAHAVGQLWLNQIDTDASAFYLDQKRRRVPLPSYPFERKKYWVDPAYIHSANIKGNAGLKEGLKEADLQNEADTTKAVVTGNAGLIKELRDVTESISGESMQDFGNATSFFEMGVDSLSLTALAYALKERFGVKITFRQLTKEASTFESLAAFILKKKERTASVESKEIVPPVAANDQNKILTTLVQKDCFRIATSDAALSCVESVHITLTGDLDIKALSNAIQALAKTHDSLRASVSADGRELRLSPPDLFNVPVVVTTCRDGDLAEIISHEMNVPFDLKSGPLFRATILQTDPHKHSLLISAHRMICDRWSMDVLIEELGKLYSSSVAQKSGFAISAYQFHGFAQTRNSFPAQDQYKQQEHYWLSEYQALPKTPKWPPNGASANAKDFDAARARMEIPPQFLQHIRQHGSESQHSLFTVLLAALSLALRSYGTMDDISIAVPMAGQAASNHPALVGQCTNLVPVRCQMSDGMTFGGYTAEIQEKIIGAYENQEYSCAFLADKLQTQESQKRLSFCSVAFTHTKKLKPEQCQYAALTVDYEFNPVHSQAFDLHFEVTEHKDILVLECSYRTALFKSAFVQEIFKDTILMLKKFSESPAAAIDFIDEDRDPMRAVIAT